MNVFVRNLLNNASRHLVTDSPMSCEGKVLAAYIARRTVQGAEPRELRDEIDRLDDILQVVAAERAEHNSRLAMGAILKNFDDDAWVLDVLESDNTNESQNLLDLLKKGDTYEISNHVCTN